MKKLLTLLIVAFIGAVVLPSCKKDWTCVCVDSNGDETSYTISDSRKPEAELACEAFSFAQDCELR